MKYYIATFGCQMNESDSRLIALSLDARGHENTSDLAEAGIVVVNTCCVRENAENRINGFIGSLKHCKTANGSIIAVCGCLAQKPGAAAEFAQKYKHVDIIVGTFALTKLPQYIEEVQLGLQHKFIDVDENYNNPDIAFSSMNIDRLKRSYKAQVSIIYGCNNFCTYCIVPYVRGRERSRDPQLILSEIRSLVNYGCKEIQLLGQNVNSYGKDLGDDWNFARLLEQVAAIDGLERVRYMTSHPRDFDLPLLNAIAQNPKICRHFHLPVQSGSAKLLKKMNRGYTPEDYLSKVEMIREKCPNASITTDLIVGFPGESDADFTDTLYFLKIAQLDAAYTFIYSKRSHTPAAEMANQIPEDLKRSRLKTLNDLQNIISLKCNQKYIGQTLSVLVEGQSKNNLHNFSGRIEQNKIVIFPVDKVSHKPQEGEIINLKITNAQTWNLQGEVTG